MYFSAQEMLAQLEGTDERICDGYYYASAFKIIKRHAENPELLEVKPETVCEDIL